MTGTTPGGLPYPDPTDPLSDGANAIRRLAEALDPLAASHAWVPIVPAAGFTASEGLAYRIVGRLVYLRGCVTRTAGAWPANVVTTVFTLPAEARLSTGLRPPIVLGAQTATPISGFATIGSNGVVGVGIQGTTASAEARFALSWFLG